jgi:lysyl-tRNA synthetase class 2
VTRSNAFDMELFLRIAPELYLKRCVVGGIDRVFEINRNFRNEGADSTHSPEFAMLEFYEAYGTYTTMADLTRELIQEAATAVFGGTTVTLADGTQYDLSGQWRGSPCSAPSPTRWGEQVGVDTPMARLVEHAGRHDVPVLGHYGPGKLAEELFEHLVVPGLYAPTFVLDYPEETSPLTRAHREVAGLTEKWDLYVRSFELATGYSELVDPVVQRERFVAQARLAARGDAEAMSLDEDFLRAMEYGMPPSGGVGWSSTV